jgi:hypothetical protein
MEGRFAVDLMVSIPKKFDSGMGRENISARPHLSPVKPENQFQNIIFPPVKFRNFLATATNPLAFSLYPILILK